MESYIARIVKDRLKLRQLIGNVAKEFEIEIRFGKDLLRPKVVEELFNSMESEEVIHEIDLGTSKSGKLRTRYLVDLQVIETKEIITTAKFGDIYIFSSIETRKPEIKMSQANHGTKTKTRRSKTERGLRTDVTFVQAGNTTWWDVEIELLTDDYSDEYLTYILSEINKITEILSSKIYMEVPKTNHSYPITFVEGKVKGWTKPRDAYLHDFSSIKQSKNDSVIFANLPVFVTPKMDGQRCILWVQSHIIYRSTPLERFTRIGQTPGPDCILDAERCLDKSGVYKYYPFDVICIENKNLTNLPFAFRVKNLDRLTKVLGLAHKPQIPVNSYNQLLDAVDQIEKLDLHIDGVILTPGNYKYKELPYKWKIEITIDVAIKSNKPYVSDKGMLVEMPTYELDVRSDDGLYECALNIKENKYILDVVRRRVDKTEPNSLVLAQRMVHALKTKTIVVRDDLRGQTAKLYTAYHNRSKRNILKYLSGSLLDVGSGTGGDVTKWKKFKSIHAVEPDVVSCGILGNAVRNRSSEEKIKVHNLLIQNFDITGLRFDHVVCFFSVNMMGLKVFVDLCKRIRNTSPKCHIHALFLDIDQLVQGREDFGFAQVKSVSSTHNCVTIFGTNVVDVVEEKISKRKLLDCVTSLGYKVIVDKKLTEERIMSNNQKAFSSLYCYVRLGL